MSQKKFTLLVVVVLVASVGGPQNAVAEDVELTFWVLTFSGDVTQAIREIAAKFDKMNPDITVTVEERGTLEHQDQLRIIMGKDVAPDIYFMWSGLGLEGWYVQRGGSLKLNDMYETYRWNDRFVNSSIAGSTYEGGQQHGVPFRLHGMNMYYRKDLFEKAGIHPGTGQMGFLRRFMEAHALTHYCRWARSWTFQDSSDARIGWTDIPNLHAADLRTRSGLGPCSSSAATRI